MNRRYRGRTQESMDVTAATFELQRLYPMIYMACHTAHRADRGVDALTPRESSLLAHLTDSDLRTPAALTAHLGIAPSTLSETMQGLVRRGLVEATRDEDDERKLHYELSGTGRRALQASSVLDEDRVQRLMKRLSPTERARALAALSLIVAATKRPDRATDDLL